MKMSITDRFRGSDLLKVLFGVLIAAIFIFIFAMNAVISIVINSDFYLNRLGLYWWYYFSMNNAAILICPAVTIVILLVVVTCLNPLTSSTLTLLLNANPNQRRFPSKLQCIAWNYGVVAVAGGLVTGWVIGFLFDGGFGMLVADHGGLDLSVFTLFNALSYPLNPGIVDIDVLFVFTYVLRPFVILIVGAIIAKSYSRTFFRNSIAIALPVLISQNAYSLCNKGDVLEIDLKQSKIKNLSTETNIDVEPIDHDIFQILLKGGIFSSLK